MHRTRTRARRAPRSRGRCVRRCHRRRRGAGRRARCRHPHQCSPPSRCSSCSRGGADPAFTERQGFGVVVDEGGQLCVLSRAWRGVGSRARPAMLSGETCSPPRAIGPPQPTPTAPRLSLDPAAAAVTPSTSSARRGHSTSASSVRGVGADARCSSSPSEVTAPAASFDPPMSTARTARVTTLVGARARQPCRPRRGEGVKERDARGTLKRARCAAT